MNSLEIVGLLIPRVKQFKLGDPRYVQAQRVWLILTAHVMTRQWQKESESQQPHQSVTIYYGKVAKRMGMDPRAGRTLADALGIIGHYCLLNDLPTLNSIVVNQETEAPGDHVVLREGKTYVDEQCEIMETDWFSWRVPTTGTFRKVWNYMRAF